MQISMYYTRIAKKAIKVWVITLQAVLVIFINWNIK